MPTINVTDEEAQQMIQALINAYPLLSKVIQQVQQQAQQVNGAAPKEPVAVKD